MKIKKKLMTCEEEHLTSENENYHQAQHESKTSELKREKCILYSNTQIIYLKGTEKRTPINLNSMKSNELKGGTSSCLTVEDDQILPSNFSSMKESLGTDIERNPSTVESELSLDQKKMQTSSCDNAEIYLGPSGATHHEINYYTGKPYKNQTGNIINSHFQIASEERPDGDISMNLKTRGFPSVKFSKPSEIKTEPSAKHKELQATSCDNAPSNLLIYNGPERTAHSKSKLRQSNKNRSELSNRKISEEQQDSLHCSITKFVPFKIQKKAINPMQKAKNTLMNRLLVSSPIKSERKLSKNNEANRKKVLFSMTKFGEFKILQKTTVDPMQKGNNALKDTTKCSVQPVTPRSINLTKMDNHNLYSDLSSVIGESHGTDNELKLVKCRSPAVQIDSSSERNVVKTSCDNAQFNLLSCRPAETPHSEKVDSYCKQSGTSSKINLNTVSRKRSESDILCQNKSVCSSVKIRLANKNRAKSSMLAAHTEINYYTCKPNDNQASNHKSSNFKITSGETPDSDISVNSKTGCFSSVEFTNPSEIRAELFTCDNVQSNLLRYSDPARSAHLKTKLRESNQIAEPCALSSRKISSEEQQDSLVISSPDCVKSKEPQSNKQNIDCSSMTKFIPFKIQKRAFNPMQKGRNTSMNRLLISPPIKYEKKLESKNNEVHKKKILCSSTTKFGSFKIPKKTVDPVQKENNALLDKTKFSVQPVTPRSMNLVKMDYHQKSNISNSLILKDNLHSNLSSIPSESHGTDNELEFLKCSSLIVKNDSSSERKVVQTPCDNAQFNLLRCHPAKIPHSEKADSNCNQSDTFAKINLQILSRKESECNISCRNKTDCSSVKFREPTENRAESSTLSKRKINRDHQKTLVISTPNKCKENLEPKDIDVSKETFFCSSKSDFSSFKIPKTRRDPMQKRNNALKDTTNSVLCAKPTLKVPAKGSILKNDNSLKINGNSFTLAKSIGQETVTSKSRSSSIWPKCSSSVPPLIDLVSPDKGFLKPCSTDVHSIEPKSLSCTSGNTVDIHHDRLIYKRGNLIENSLTDVKITPMNREWTGSMHGNSIDKSAYKTDSSLEIFKDSLNILHQKSHLVDLPVPSAPENIPVLRSFTSDQEHYKPVPCVNISPSITVQSMLETVVSYTKSDEVSEKAIGQQTGGGKYESNFGEFRNFHKVVPEIDNKHVDSAVVFVCPSSFAQTTKTVEDNPSSMKCKELQNFKPALVQMPVNRSHRQTKSINELDEHGKEENLKRKCELSCIRKTTGGGLNCETATQKKKCKSEAHVTKDWRTPAIEVPTFHFNRYPVSRQLVKGGLSHLKRPHDARICPVCKGNRDKRILISLKKRLAPLKSTDDIFYDTKENVLAAISKYNKLCHAADSLRKMTRGEAQKIVKTEDPRVTEVSKVVIPSAGKELPGLFTPILTKSDDFQKKIANAPTNFEFPQEQADILTKSDDLEKIIECESPKKKGLILSEKMDTSFSERRKPQEQESVLTKTEELKMKIETEIKKCHLSKEIVSILTKSDDLKKKIETELIEKQAPQEVSFVMTSQELKNKETQVRNYQLTQEIVSILSKSDGLKKKIQSKLKNVTNSDELKIIENELTKCQLPQEQVFNLSKSYDLKDIEIELKTNQLPEGQVSILGNLDKPKEQLDTEFKKTELPEELVSILSKSDHLKKTMETELSKYQLSQKQVSILPKVYEPIKCQPCLKPINSTANSELPQTESKIEVMKCTSPKQQESLPKKRTDAGLKMTLDYNSPNHHMLLSDDVKIVNNEDQEDEYSTSPCFNVLQEKKTNTMSTETNNEENFHFMQDIDIPVSVTSNVQENQTKHGQQPAKKFQDIETESAVAPYPNRNTNITKDLKDDNEKKCVKSLKEVNFPDICLNSKTANFQDSSNMDILPLIEPNTIGSQAADDAPESALYEVIDEVKDDDDENTDENLGDEDNPDICFTNNVMNLEDSQDPFENNLCFEVIDEALDDDDDSNKNCGRSGVLGFPYICSNSDLAISEDSCDINMFTAEGAPENTLFYETSDDSRFTQNFDSRDTEIAGDNDQKALIRMSSPSCVLKDYIGNSDDLLQSFTDDSSDLSSAIYKTGEVQITPIAQNDKDIPALSEQINESTQKPQLEVENVKNTAIDYYQLEKEDIDNPNWEEYRNITTDKAHYETVRKHWRSQYAPNPHHNLTVLNSRRKRTGVLPVSIGRNPKRKAEDELIFDEAPNKRQCLIPSTFLQEKELAELDKQYHSDLKQLKQDMLQQEETVHLNYNHLTRNFQKNISNSIVSHTRVSKNRSINFADQVFYQEMLRLKKKFHILKTNINNSYNQRWLQIQSHMNEIKSFDAFYVGLQEEAQNTCLISVKEKQNILLTNALIQNFKLIYSLDI